MIFEWLLTILGLYDQITGANFCDAFVFVVERRFWQEQFVSIIKASLHVMIYSGLKKVLASRYLQSYCGKHKKGRKKRNVDNKG